MPLPFSDSNGTTEEKKAFLNGSADADVGASKVDIVGTRKGTQVQVHFEGKKEISLNWVTRLDG